MLESGQRGSQNNLRFSYGSLRRLFGVKNRPKNSSKKSKSQVHRAATSFLAGETVGFCADSHAGRLWQKCYRTRRAARGCTGGESPLPSVLAPRDAGCQHTACPTGLSRVAGCQHTACPCTISQTSNAKARPGRAQLALRLPCPLRCRMATSRISAGAKT